MSDSINLNEMLESKGWAQIEFDHGLAQSLREKALHSYRNQYFKPAGLANSQNQNIRNDHIYWLDANTVDAAEKKTFQILTNYLDSIKNYFRLPLTHFECHYAQYPIGHFYQKHSDQKMHDNKRYFSWVIYLNESWTESDGGELVAYASTPNRSEDPLALV